jgi:hypothetical protein
MFLFSSSLRPVCTLHFNNTNSPTHFSEPRILVFGTDRRVRAHRWWTPTPGYAARSPTSYATWRSGWWTGRRGRLTARRSDRGLLGWRRQRLGCGWIPAIRTRSGASGGTGARTQAAARSTAAIQTQSTWISRSAPSPTTQPTSHSCIQI